MTTLAGTGKLIRLILRRERLRLGIWVVVLVIVPVFTATAFIDLYPDLASREALAATSCVQPGADGASRTAVRLEHRRPHRLARRHPGCVLRGTHGDPDHDPAHPGGGGDRQA